MATESSLQKSFLVVGAIVLFFLVAASLWLDVENGHYEWRPLHHRYFMYAATPAAIESWMTFDYLNHVFQLPPTYLETSLNIQDPEYPNISLAGYSESHNLDAAVFLGSVESAIKAHTGTTTLSTP